MGIRRSYKSLEQSDLRIIIFDSSRPLSKGDQALLKSCEGLKTIVVLNKVDLKSRLKLQSAESTVNVSCVTGTGIEALRDAIELAACHTEHTGKQAEVTINDRHKDAIQRAIEALSIGIKEMQQGLSLELVAQPYRVALSAIGEVVGRTSTEDLLSKVFSTFCIGK